MVGSKNEPALMLDSEAGTTLCTACCNYCTTATGLHAHQEAMRAGTMYLRRLVSAFHMKSPVSFI